MGKDEILRALPKLTKAELEALQAVINGLLGAHTGGIGTPTAPVIWQACTAALGLTIGFVNLPPALQKAFNRQASDLTEFCQSRLHGYDQTKNIEMAFFYDLFDLLKNDLLSREVKPTISNMIHNMGRMPYVIDQAYPGYLNSGLGHLILRGYGVGLATKAKKTI